MNNSWICLGIDRDLPFSHSALLVYAREITFDIWLGSAFPIALRVMLDFISSEMNNYDEN